jgi:tetratricopeptide (TPR) repeat protein
MFLLVSQQMILAEINAHKPVAVPSGLTAFEYYRLGARLSTDSTDKFHEEKLQTSKKALEIAYSMDKNGYIGQLAHNHLQTQLPIAIPNNEILGKYKDALDDLDREKPGAEQLLNQCIVEAPQFDWPYATLAEVYLDQKHFGPASALLDKEKQINANSVPYLLALGRLQESQGKKEAAIASVKKAIDEDPLNRKSYERLLHLLTSD